MGRVDPVGWVTSYIAVSHLEPPHNHQMRALISHVVSYAECIFKALHVRKVVLPQLPYTIPLCDVRIAVIR